MQINARPLLSSLLAVSITLAVGCSSRPTIELPDPKDVPREKWSDAMLILDAMGITGQRDIPLELAVAGPTTAAPSINGASAGDAAITAGNFVSPPSGFSSGAALGLGLGLMLLGGSGPPVAHVQTVAWVPANLVNSPEEASSLVLKTMEDARIKVFPNKRSPDRLTVGKYMPGSGRVYADASDIFNHRPVQLDTPATPSPAVVNVGQAYGPIFVHDEQYWGDAYSNNMKPLDSMVLMSKVLPEWIYIYYPGQRLRKDSVPARILKKGEPLYFVGK
ncbi:hypothetical protein V0R50_16220 [Pseudomonas sp. 148P]|uniref:Lipoprotein n=1 Tax=Pseudomonas ulcerans TaxID=3115852 RepID=A0ABU7HTA6_9PSED|nr:MULTISPECIES: hypothetical protein [unclassified Pseudomonas]MEE1923348.1 hypothetical protein [Pseudomonas sp. 147P]MEE1934776.1 hypothetical protein [Pseudomonas sp. 148P]